MRHWKYLQCIPLSVLMLSGCSVDDLLVRRQPKESPLPTYNTVEMSRHNELEAENIRLRTQNAGLQAEVQRLQGQLADAERRATETKLQSPSASYPNIQPKDLLNAKVETIPSYSPSASSESSNSASTARNRSSSTSYTPSSPKNSGYSAGGYIRGPRGGCYTYSGSGRKRYVDRSLCN